MQDSLNIKLERSTSHVVFGREGKLGETGSSFLLLHCDLN